MTDTQRQRGSALVMVAGGLVALLGATALAVDLGYFFLAKNQFQNAVDAAVLAGAKEIIAQPGDYDAAKARAMEYASKNEADTQPVILSSDEITFCSDERLNDCTSNPADNRSIVRVAINRNVQTFFGLALGVSEVTIGVSAAAGAVSTRGGPARGGWRPFAIPDQFANPQSGTRVMTRPFGQAYDESALGPCDPACLIDPSCGKDPLQDYYISPYSEDLMGMDLSREYDFGIVTGYIAMRDVIDLFFQPIALKVGDPNSGKTSPGQFFPIDYPPNSGGVTGGGAAEYVDVIINGYDGEVNVGDIIYVEPGNMRGPTRNAVAQLIDQDPGAYLVLENGAVRVEGSAFPDGQSPRVFPIPFYAPDDPPGTGKEYLTVSNIGAFFAQSMCGDDVLGVFVPLELLGGQDTGIGDGGRLGVTVKLIE